MTLDDDNSVYVGGLPYEATENDLRRTFDLYGAVVAVKIVNDQEVGGKCYGFVTFTNPRSAVDAINDMNGRTIGGRVVRVNEVRTRGGRAASHRENFRRDVGRDNDWDRDNDHIRDRDRDRDRFRDRNTEHGRDRDRDRGNERGRDIHRAKDQSFERGRDCSVHDQERPRDHDEDWERDRDMWDEDREMDKTRNHETIGEEEQRLRTRLSDHLNNRRSRDLSSNSGDDYEHQVKEELETSIRKSQELHKELELINSKVDEKGQHVSVLQKKVQKLEDALAAAKKLTSQRQSMLVKLHQGFQHAQDMSERLKSSEQELKFLVDTAMAEVDTGEDTGNRDALAHANGQGMNVGL